MVKVFVFIVVVAGSAGLWQLMELLDQLIK